MERRAELEHPLGLAQQPPDQPAPALDRTSLPTGPAEFVLEIGAEELPAQDVTLAAQQLRWVLRVEVGIAQGFTTRHSPCNG